MITGGEYMVLAVRHLRAVEQQEEEEEKEEDVYCHMQ